jgi:hypothetical protein
MQVAGLPEAIDLEPFGSRAGRFLEADVQVRGGLNEEIVVVCRKMRVMYSALRLEMKSVSGVRLSGLLAHAAETSVKITLTILSMRPRRAFLEMLVLLATNG